MKKILVFLLFLCPLFLYSQNNDDSGKFPAFNLGLGGSDKKLKNTHVLSFNKLLKRRLHSEPIAYILKRKEFFSKNFYVNYK